LKRCDFRGEELIAQNCMYGINEDKLNMKKIKLLIIALLFSSVIYTQEATSFAVENPRVKRPMGLSLNLGGPTILVSASLDYFILPILNIEAGGGIWGYYAGPKYHFRGQRNMRTTLYTGVLVTAIPPLPGSDVFYKAGWNVPEPKTNYDFYIPIGISNMSRSGYTFSLEIATSRRFIDSKIPFIFSAKFG